jgi:hypothetical protein
MKQEPRPALSGPTSLGLRCERYRTASQDAASNVKPMSDLGDSPADDLRPSAVETASALIACHGKLGVPCPKSDNGYCDET